MKTKQFSSCQECEYRGLRMFCNLSPDALREFDGIGVQMVLPKGAILFHEEEQAQSVAVICEGQLKLSCTSSDGKTLILKVAMPGDVLGLSSVLTGTFYEVTAEALETCLVKCVAKSSFLNFLEKYGQASLHAAKSISDDYQTAFYDAKRLALSSSVKARVASVLLDLGRSACCGKNEMRFTMALTHDELASLAGTTRESISRVLGGLKKENLIQIRGSSIYIPHPAQLEVVSR
jgi:CRP/FNR family cyclic AMP-dependent transcriptional regulator